MYLSIGLAVSLACAKTLVLLLGLALLVPTALGAWQVKRLLAIDASGQAEQLIWDEYVNALTFFGLMAAVLAFVRPGTVFELGAFRPDEFWQRLAVTGMMAPIWAYWVSARKYRKATAAGKKR